MHRKQITYLILAALTAATMLAGCAKKKDSAKDAPPQTAQNSAADAEQQKQSETENQQAVENQQAAEGQQAVENQQATENQQAAENQQMAESQGSAGQTEALTEAVTEAQTQYIADAVMLEVTPIDQSPELPTGCEMTSLTMVLNYLGVEADKCDLSDNYLEKGEVGTVDFHEAFEGDPRDESSFGCYAPVVVDTANKYLQTMGSEMVARDISGGELEDLFVYLRAGIPVVVWGTRNCEEGHFSVTWNVDGKELTWFTPEHCMALIGYDEEQVWVGDPLYGEIRSYDLELFRKGYESLFRQAVVIQ